MKIRDTSKDHEYAVARGWVDPSSAPSGLVSESADALYTSETDTTKRLAPDGAGGVLWHAGLVVDDEGTPLATAADTLNFVGAGVTATGTGSTKTITIPGTSTTNFELNIEGGQDVIKAHGNLGATATFDPTDGNVHAGTLNANCTFTLNVPTGTGACSLEFWLTEDGTGGRTVTWPGSVTEQGTHDTTLSTTQRVIVETVDTGTTWIATWIGGGIPSSSFATPAIVLGTAAAAGSAATTIRSDSTIVAFDSTTPANIGTAATGSVAKAARRDHVHATGAGTPTTQALGDSATTGTGPAASMTDHKHGMPALSTATPLVESGAGAVGTAVPSSREDHVHPAASAGGTVEPVPVWNITFNGDGSQTAFELPAAPYDAYSIGVYVGTGRNNDWTLSGTMLTTLTFGSAPTSGTANISIDIMAATL